MYSKDEDSGSIYTTSDLGCAAALIATNHPLHSLDKSNPRRALFVFIEDERLKTAVQAYWGDYMRVSPMKYGETLKAVKSRIYNE
jgi:hypothetical protein